MTTDTDVLRLWAYCDEAAMATDKLLEMLEAVLSDEDDGPLRDQLLGARMKCRTAMAELGKGRQFLDAAREKVRRW